MANLYIYFISSLPLLHFGMKPPFSLEQFLQKCIEYIPPADARILEVIGSAQYPAKNAPTIKKWLNFDTRLRNELVRLRAGRKKTDPAKYLRPDGYAGPQLYHIALAAQRNPSPLEGEKGLDMERWRYLDELCFGHYFDLDFLIIYAYKLMLLERWERINKADKARLLTGVLSKDQRL